MGTRFQNEVSVVVWKADGTTWSTGQVNGSPLRTVKGDRAADARVALAMVLPSTIGIEIRDKRRRVKRLREVSRDATRVGKNPTHSLEIMVYKLYGCVNRTQCYTHIIDRTKDWHDGFVELTTKFDEESADARVEMAKLLPSECCNVEVFDGRLKRKRDMRWENFVRPGETVPAGNHATAS